MGIGGWLALLIVLLGILDPLSTLITVVADDELGLSYAHMKAADGYEMYKASVLAMTVAFSAVSVVAAYRLLRSHTPNSVRLAKVAVWLSGPVIATVETLAAWIFIDNAGVAVDGKIVFVIELLLSAALHAYLSRSQRVKNTYYQSSMYEDA